MRLMSAACFICPLAFVITMVHLNALLAQALYLSLIIRIFAILRLAYGLATALVHAFLKRGLLRVLGRDEIVCPCGHRAEKGDGKDCAEKNSCVHDGLPSVVVSSFNLSGSREPNFARDPSEVDGSPGLDRSAPSDPEVATAPTPTGRPRHGIIHPA